MTLIIGKLHSCENAHGKVDEAVEHIKSGKLLAWQTQKRVGIGPCKYIFVREKGPVESTPVFALMKVEDLVEVNDVTRDMRPLKPIHLAAFEDLDGGSPFYVISKITPVAIPFEELEDMNGNHIPARNIATDFRNVQAEVNLL